MSACEHEPARGCQTRARALAVLGALTLPVWLALASAQPAADLGQQVCEAERAFARSMAERDHAAFARFLAEEAVFLGDGPVASTRGPLSDLPPRSLRSSGAHINPCNPGEAAVRSVGNSKKNAPELTGPAKVTASAATSRPMVAHNNARTAGRQSNNVAIRRPPNQR